MAQTASGDTRVKAFGLAAHLTLEALIDHLINSGVMSPAGLQIVFLEALRRCAVHELPASPWQAEAAQARDILNKSKADALNLHGP
jgi:hypothetical protein